MNQSEALSSWRVWMGAQWRQEGCGPEAQAPTQRKDNIQKSWSGRGREAGEIVEKVDNKSVKADPHIYSKFLA